MKKILLSIIVLTSAIGTTKAQNDYCKDIKKYGVQAVTPLPSWKSSEPAIQISFGKNDDHRIELGLVNNSTASTDSKTDVSVGFEDGTKLNFPNQSTTAMPKGYGGYTVHFVVSNSTMNKFRSARIKSLTMMGQTTEAISDNYKNKIMGYANCSTFATDPLNQTSEEKTAAISASVDAELAAAKATQATADAAKAAAEAEKQAAADAAEAIKNRPESKKLIDGFWGVKFGSTVAEAKAILLKKTGSAGYYDAKKGTIALLFGTFANRKVSSILLEFHDGKFYAAGVSYPAPDEKSVISQFDTMVNELAALYGDSNAVTDFQAPFTKGGDYQILAIQTGKADYYNTWYSKNAQGNDNTITLSIQKNLEFSLIYIDGTINKTVQNKEAKKQAADY